MRNHGTLTTWNDERGFGFIESATGIDKFFVHISAFPRDGVRPRLGELVSFEIELRDGKKRAVRLMRPASPIPPRRARQPEHAPSRAHPLGSLAFLTLIIALGWYGYQRFATDRTPPPAPVAQATRNIRVPPAPAFHCDGRTRCPQMRSCAEATFFLEQCPSTQMDGDNDGVPCESQWCRGGGLATDWDEAH